MIDGKKVVALIPARGGSKGLLGKNIRDLGGRPLIAWTIAAAQASTTIDEIILSSDDAEIIRVAAEHGCPRHILRPAELASDIAKAIDVVHSVQDALEAESNAFDILVLLQPTSPLRAPKDIDACVAKVAAGASVAVSVTPTSKSPYWMYEKTSEDTLRPLLTAPKKAWQRQQLPTTYALNGAVYAAEWTWLASADSFIVPDTHAYAMPKERAVDIDTEVDMVIAEHQIAKTTP